MSPIDVVLCVGRRDRDRLFRACLKSCIAHFDPLGHVFVVTDDRHAVQEFVDRWHLPRNVTVLDDLEVLPRELHAFPGWVRQQAIKLYADRIATTSLVACLGADTVLLRHVGRTDVVQDGQPVLYYNRYRHIERHLRYERRRVRHVARILGVTPTRALPLGDFIMDLTVFDRRVLRSLRGFLELRHGNQALARILPRSCRTESERARFGEWTLYAVYVLDVLGITVPLRNSNSRYLAQVHSPSDLRRYAYDSQVVHFVDKQFDLVGIEARLGALGLA